MRKKIFLAGLVSIILIVAGFFYFFIINTKEIHAGVPGGGPACFIMFDCQLPYQEDYDICGFGYGFAGCTNLGLNPPECSNCAIDLESLPEYNVERRCQPISGAGVCQVQINGGPGWYNCYQCYDSTNPPPPPSGCDVTENYDYNNALYFQNSNGDNVFAFTDAGQILTTVGDVGVWINQTDIEDEFSNAGNNNFPIYDQNGDLIAFIGEPYQSVFEYTLLLKGEVYSYRPGELLPPNGSFIIQNSFGDVVSYIDSNGDLYLLGCVSENEHFVP